MLASSAVRNVVDAVARRAWAVWSWAWRVCWSLVRRGDGGASGMGMSIVVGLD